MPFMKVGISEARKSPKKRTGGDENKDPNNDMRRSSDWRTFIPGNLRTLQGLGIPGSAAIESGVLVPGTLRVSREVEIATSNQNNDAQDIRSAINIDVGGGNQRTGVRDRDSMIPKRNEGVERTKEGNLNGALPTIQKRSTSGSGGEGNQNGMVQNESVVDDDDDDVIILESEDEKECHFVEVEGDGENQNHWRSFIPKEAFAYLGLDPKVLLNGDAKSENKNNGLEFHEQSPTHPQSSSTISHFYVRVDGQEEKEEFMFYMDLEKEDKTIIFCSTSETVERLSTKLRQKSLLPQVIHEKIPPSARRAILSSFKDGYICRLMICTDILLQTSLDWANTIVNFDLPQSKSIYLKRMAFTARVNPEPGTSVGDIARSVINMVSSDQEMKRVKELEKEIGFPIKDCCE